MPLGHGVILRRTPLVQHSVAAPDVKGKSSRDFLLLASCVTSREVKFCAES
ncbi:hypothetical protein SGUI_1761 [Serinicoccus hydrothermalis]|uniref:Uncharacterized protein n=1 Tax=Serinicoccus hydrothermalis TaxID=1758689 RepID=A0A1B1NCK1_9MICO|nr:hypothetical protein SGUI_1761 [Serinicoccus hydrothermalis]